MRHDPWVDRGDGALPDWAGVGAALLRPSSLVVFVALALALTTWVNLASADPAAAATETPLLLFVMAAVAILGVVLRHADPWLAAFVVFAAANAARMHGPFALSVAQWIGLAALLLVLARQLSPHARQTTGALLLAGGVFQTAYAAQQWAGYDLLWAGFTVIERPMILGTLGNPNYLGAYLAMIVPLVPVTATWTVRGWRVPMGAALLALFGMGFVLAHSILATVAAAVGLSVRWAPALRRALDWATLPRSTRALLLGLIALFIIVVGLGATAIRMRGYPQTAWRSYYEPGVRVDLPLNVYQRLAVWKIAMVDGLGNVPLMGWGPGAWYWRVPALQRQQQVYWREYFAQAHNELIQHQYEYGFVGVALLAGWLWHWRTMWRTEYAGALAAVAVDSLGMFPMRLATLAPIALLLVALATPTFAHHMAAWSRCDLCCERCGEVT